MKSILHTIPIYDWWLEGGRHKNVWITRDRSVSGLIIIWRRESTDNQPVLKKGRWILGRPIQTLSPNVWRKRVGLLNRAPQKGRIVEATIRIWESERAW